MRSVSPSRLRLPMIGVAVAGVALSAWMACRSVPPAPQAARPASAPPAAQPAPQAAAAAAPSFDIVRVAPDGSTVLAGRAEPGAAVTVQQNGRTLAEAKADPNGAWVMVPDAKLPAGPGELTLSARQPDGQVAVADAPVVFVVPPRADANGTAAASPALALLAPPAAPSRLLQAPGPAKPAGLGVGTVDYDEHGAIRFSGSAPPNAPVRVYVDNGKVGDATAGPDGRWAISPPDEVRPGVHELRLDQLTPRGQVAARVELPFQREVLAAAQVSPGQIVVQPGQNLWRLARNVYGSGIRYTVIFLANRGQIRDARLIYPGQVFTTPDEAGSEPAR